MNNWLQALGIIWSVFIPIPKKNSAKECSDDRIIALISHASKIMLKILEARLQQYVNRKLPNVQAGFRKEKPEIKSPASLDHRKSREFQKNIYFCFIDYVKVIDCEDHKKIVENSSRDGNTRPPYLSPEKLVCRSRNNS